MYKLFVNKRQYGNNIAVELAKRVPMDHGYAFDRRNFDEIAKRDGELIATRILSSRPLPTKRAVVGRPALACAAAAADTISDPSQEQIKLETAPVYDVIVSTFITMTALSQPAPSTISFACDYHGDDPDESVALAYCVCSMSITSIITAFLLRNSAGIWQSSGTNSCPYLAWPVILTASLTIDLGPVTTITPACQICSLMVINENACISIFNCTPEVAVATVSVGSMLVHVGTLIGTALYSSVSLVFAIICPSVTQTTAMTECSGSARIGGVAYVADESLYQDGELVVNVGLSAYNATSMRNAMINSLAASA